MRALVISGAGRYTLVDHELPPAGRGDLTLAPLAVGLCATDLELLDVHALGSRLEVVKQHALLKRRKRVTVLDHGTPEGHRERSLGSVSQTDLDPSATVIIIGKIIL